MVTVERDGAYLIFRRDGVEFYDTAVIPAQADVGRLIRHLGDKCGLRRSVRIAWR